MKKIILALSLFAVCVSFSSASIIPPVNVNIDGYVYTDPYPLMIPSAPIAGVKVYLLSSTVIPMKAATVTSIPVFTSDSSTTDASGHFAFKPSSAGYYSISFQHSGFVTRDMELIALKDTTMRVSLLAAGAHALVKGKVWASAILSALIAPLPKCTVTVTEGLFVIPLINQSAFSPIVTGTFTAITDDSGNYSIDSVPISSNNTPVTVSARKAGYLAQGVDTSVSNAKTTTVNFTLHPNLAPVITPAKPEVMRAAGLRLTREQNIIKMEYMLGKPAFMRVNVFNARGVQVKQVYNMASACAGMHNFSWTAAEPGVYFVSVDVNGVAAASRKIIISK
jgi:hypothetical protein